MNANAATTTTACTEAATAEATAGTATQVGRTTLILVDCQQDFHPGGSLAIPTANEDAERIAHLIRTHALKIDRIVATMDSHLKLHIAHPCFWYYGGESDGGESFTHRNRQHPKPFTIISARDIQLGIWKPRSDLVLPAGQVVDPAIFFQESPAVSSGFRIHNDDGSLDLNRFCLEYTTRLEAGGQFQLCIWPEHCLIGSTGHALVPCIQQALHEWSEQTGNSVEFVLKGQHLLTEMYSGLQAAVPVSRETEFNQTLLDSLLFLNANNNNNNAANNERQQPETQQQQKILVCGQAMSHCVNYTMRDLVKHWPRDRTSELVVLTDCASPVPGFEWAARTFLQDMKEQGVALERSHAAFLPN